jgi:hypothetical protein
VKKAKFSFEDLEVWQKAVEFAGKEGFREFMPCE